MATRAIDVPLIRTAAHDSAERRRLQRDVHRGLLAVVRPGVFVEQAVLAALRPEEAHLLLVRATAPRVRPPARISHLSAAAVHRLPYIGDPPSRVDLVDPRRGKTETTAMTRVRPDRSGAHHLHERWAAVPSVQDVGCDGAGVTSLVRTLVDVAAVAPLTTSLPMLDAALHARAVWPEMLEFELARGLREQTARASLAVRAGSALSGSPAESMCRVRFRQLGTPEPVQQHEFRRPGEQTAVVDFWFPVQGVVVEVDGRGKYEDPDLLGASTTADAYWREKRREDFVRSFPEVRFVVRLSWSDLMHPERVRQALRRAGVPCR